jgi:hypothetical protein
VNSHHREQLTDHIQAASLLPTTNTAASFFGDNKVVQLAIYPNSNKIIACS